MTVPTSLAAAGGRGTAPELVRLLDVEPDFGIGVDAIQFAEARRRTFAPVVTVPPGPWQPSALRTPDTVTGPFAALLLAGLLTREYRLSDRTTTQLLGAGDIVPLTAPDESALAAAHVWRAAVATRIAVLDERFLAAAQRWPWLTARMAERALKWADRALVLQGISQLARVDARIVALLWHLADRWGRVCPQGVVVPLKLTHAAIGSLVGARRPTVTLALKDLQHLGAVRPHGDAWLLSADSRNLLTMIPSLSASGPSASVNVVSHAGLAAASGTSLPRGHLTAL